MTSVLSIFVTFLVCLVGVNAQSASDAPDGLLTQYLFKDSIVQSYGARCLDNSPAGLYYRAGKGHRFIIYLEGGAFCTGEADCIARSQTALGSSRYWTNPMPPIRQSDILSNDYTTNPHFADFHAVLVPYCSGDLWLGNNTNPSPTSWNLSFAGAAIFRAAVQTLVQDFNLGAATEVVLTGVSAGGMGVFYHLDEFAAYIDKLTMFRARVVGVPQAGWFSVANSWSQWLADPTAAYVPPTPDVVSLYYVNNIIQVIHPYPCNLISDPALQYTCVFYIPGYYHNVHTPMFVAENLFDRYQIFNENLVPNVNNVTVDDYFEYFGATMRASLIKYIVKGWQKYNGLYAAPCLEHELKYSGAGAVPVNGKTFVQSLTDWYLGKEVTAAQRYSVDSSPVPTCFADQ